jgi:hypothetical protein
MKTLCSRIIPLALIIATLTACATRTSYVNLYGDPAPPSSAERTIVIRPDIKYVNVEGGQTVRFVVGDKDFAWHFFSARFRDFNLADVAPPGILDHAITAYVSPDPRYRPAP